MPSRSRSTRAYSAAHRAMRARLLPFALFTYCPCGLTSTCAHRCDGLMVDPSRMDLDHSTPVVLGGGEAGDRMVCRTCNRSAGASLGNQLRGRRASREW